MKITGFFSRFVGAQNCDGAVHPWKVVVSSDNGLYAKGAATVVTDGFACGLIECTDVGSSGDVTLCDGGPQALGQSASGTTLCASHRSDPLYTPALI